MAKKNSKVSITKLDAFLKTMKTDAVETSVLIDGEILDFEVKPLLGLTDFHNMVSAVVDAAFVIDEETGVEHYDAVYEQYARDIAVLTYVANFKSETASEKLYLLSQNDAVMEEIRKIWDTCQEHNFDVAVANQIVYKQKELLATERRELQKAVEQIDKAGDAFMKFIDMFKNINPNMMMEQMQKISDMDEERLGQAVVAARDQDFVEQRKAELQVLK